MFLITNKHFNSQTFGLETIFHLPAPPPDGSTHLMSIWLVDRWWWDRCSVQSPAKKSLSCQVTEPLAAWCSEVILEDRDALRSDVSLCFDFIYSPSFYFLWQKMVLLLSERRGGGRCSSLSLSFRGRSDFFFLPQEDVWWIDGFILWMFRKRGDVAMTGCCGVIFYSDFVCIKKWCMNFNCLIC